MNNNTYDISVTSSSPYIILVKQFTGAYYSVPSAGTKAYSFPKDGSSVIYTFPQSTSSTTRYVINSIVYCDSNYWAKYPNLGNNLDVGYVKCSDINFDYTTYADPDNQIPNPQIGTNTTDIFNMWYFPIDSITGVNYAIPLYYQYYYIYGNRRNMYNCTLLASISGDYMYDGINFDPTTYLNNMTNTYWGPDGLTSWIASMSLAGSQSAIRTKAKSNLNAHKPFLVGANNGSLDHLVLVVGYRNSGNNLSDYIVLDSCSETFSDLATFFNSFPNFPTTWGISGSGYVYGEY